MLPVKHKYKTVQDVKAFKALFRPSRKLQRILHRLSSVFEDFIYTYFGNCDIAILEIVSLLKHIAFILYILFLFDGKSQMIGSSGKEKKNKMQTSSQTQTSDAMMWHHRQLPHISKLKTIKNQQIKTFWRKMLVVVKITANTMAWACSGAAEKENRGNNYVYNSFCVLVYSFNSCEVTH